MSFEPSSPITGSAQSLLTNPTYTLSADTPPSAHAVQWAVTAVGGTQTGVNVHSVSEPFTIAAFKPAVPRALGNPNRDGIVANVPKNNYKVVTRKSVAVNAVQKGLVIIRTTMEIPAGADVEDEASIQAALSAHIGAVNAESSDLGALCADGLL